MLVPIDGSRFSFQNEEVAANIANKFNSRVTVLHVVPHAIRHQSTEFAQQVPDSIREEMEDWFLQRGKQALEEAKRFFAGGNVRVDTMLVEFADPAETILKVAKEKRSDIIVIGNRGTGEIEEFALGSVAEKVLRYAECTVLIVKRETAISKILVAIDGSKHAQKALEYAVQLALKHNASVTLINVTQTVYPYLKANAAKSIGELIVSKAARQVKELKVDKRVEIGQPAKTILEVAKNENYDLIALGNRGLIPAERFLFGSVSDKVAGHAQCSVLIVK
jgi:nucleotide-binding universal stress UspA family protein